MCIHLEFITARPVGKLFTGPKTYFISEKAVWLVDVCVFLEMETQLFIMNEVSFVELNIAGTCCEVITTYI